MISRLRFWTKVALLAERLPVPRFVRVYIHNRKWAAWERTP